MGDAHPEPWAEWLLSCHSGIVPGFDSCFMGTGLRSATVLLAPPARLRPWRLQVRNRRLTPSNTGKHLFLSCQVFCYDAWHVLIWCRYRPCRAFFTSIGLAGAHLQDGPRSPTLSLLRTPRRSQCSFVRPAEADACEPCGFARRSAPRTRGVRLARTDQSGPPR